MKTICSIVLFLILPIISIFGQSENTKSLTRQEYQIYLKQPAKEIKLLMYEKDFTPIQGRLSEDKKSIIINNYQIGTKVHIKVIYEDGTVDEYTKSPCFIDPVI